MRLANRIVVVTLGGIAVITVTVLLRVGVQGRSKPEPPSAPRPGAAFITGQITDRGQAVNSGALIMASLAEIPNPPPAIRMSKPPKPPIFSGTAGSDGTYELEVDPNSKPYHVRAFYPVLDDAGRVVTHSKSATSVLVAGPGIKVKQDFSWP